MRGAAKMKTSNLSVLMFRGIVPSQARMAIHVLRAGFFRHLRALLIAFPPRHGNGVKRRPGLHRAGLRWMFAAVTLGFALLITAPDAHSALKPVGTETPYSK